MTLPSDISNGGNIVAAPAAPPGARQLFEANIRRHAEFIMDFCTQRQIVVEGLAPNVVVNLNQEAYIQTTFLYGDTKYHFSTMPNGDTLWRITYGTVAREAVAIQ